MRNQRAGERTQGPASRGATTEKRGIYYDRLTIISVFPVIFPRRKPNAAWDLQIGYNEEVGMNRVQSSKEHAQFRGFLLNRSLAEHNP